MQSIKTVEQFDAVKSATKTVAVRAKEKEHRRQKKVGWSAIRVQLVEFHATDKTMLERRWAALAEILSLCLAYKGEKETTDRTGKRAAFAEELGNQALLRLHQERTKAQEYSDKVNERPQLQAGRRSAGASVGGVGPHGATKFERALPEGSIYHGVKLATQAQGDGVVLSGDDFKDAYALRAYVKKIEKDPDLAGDFKGRAKIPYFTDTERTAHRLTFETHQITWQGLPFNTVGIQGPDVGISDHQAMYAMDQYGGVYARKQITKFNHSCFTAGESVVCAGMITAINGRLTHISNGSGHYGPGMLELLDACEVIQETAYNNFRDCYVVYQDFANVFGRGVKDYRFPFLLFLQANGMVNNPQELEVDMPRGQFSYTYVNPKAAFNRGARIDAQLLPKK